MVVFMRLKRQGQDMTFLFFKVEVRVVDINDHAPQFPLPEKTLDIPENSAVQTRFYITPAEDPDSTDYSIVRYVRAATREALLIRLARDNGACKAHHS